MALSGDDWPPLAVEIPDDARELDRDVAAYHRELRAARIRRRIERVLLPPPWRGRGLLASLSVAGIVALAVVGSVLTMFVPTRPQSAPPLPLAADAGPVGQIGGLLPDASLHADPAVSSESARLLRPGVITLVPAGCACDQVIANIAGQAEEFRLDLYLVADATGPDPALTSLATGPAHGYGTVLYDDGGVLTSAYSPDPAGVTVLAVHADGVLAGVTGDVTSQTRFEHLLTGLREPGRPITTTASFSTSTIAH
jgi:hypothetical protein